MGEKTRTDKKGNVTQGWDHDPPPKEKQVPFGFLIMGISLLTLIFSNRETSDAWVDALMIWWKQIRDGFSHIKRLVFYLDNGPNNNGRRTQFLKRMVQFSDWSGLEVHLIYYPPYHSKYNPVERCWASLEKKWNGVLLKSVAIMLECAQRMTWKGRHPIIRTMTGVYPNGVSLTRTEMKKVELRLERSVTLPKYDILIRPKK